MHDELPALLVWRGCFGIVISSFQMNFRRILSARVNPCPPWKLFRQLLEGTSLLEVFPTFLPRGILKKREESEMLRRIFRRKKWRDEKMMRICRSRFASER